MKKRRKPEKKRGTVLGTVAESLAKAALTFAIGSMLRGAIPVTGVTDLPKT